MVHSTHTIDEILYCISSSFCGLAVSKHSFAMVRMIEPVGGTLSHTTELAKARAQEPFHSLIWG